MEENAFLSCPGGATVSFSLTFWIVTLVLVLFMTGILTAAYNDDKTKGL